MSERHLYREFVVSSWSELMELLYHDSWSPKLKRFRSSYVYRGLRDKDYQLSTTLNRLGESHLEKHLLRNFMKYAHKDSQFDNVWNWLALAQHHGLPTRLLDWTYSPMVALHFATAAIKSFYRDSAIWAINYVDVHKYFPGRLKEAIATEGSHIFTAEMLLRAVDSLPDLMRMKDEPFAVFLEPPSLDDRIVNQYSVFSMMSDPNSILSEWIKGKEIRSFKIIIPAELKWEIRDKLDQANVNERVMFPGLDGLARWLKRQYIDIRDGEDSMED